MSYKFNPLVSLGLDQIASYAALNVLGTVANQAALPGGATTGDVYQAENDGIFYVWDGAAWDSIGTLAGPAGPAGATGPAGADGADGTDGADGADGQTILNGTVDPTDNVTGTDGDFYINTASNEIFGPRTAGAWGSGTSLVGPAGAGGATTLGGLTDVDLTTSPPTNGEALVYDSVNSEWVPGSAGATAAGAANQIQYNDGAGGLAASSDFTVNVDWDNPSTTFTALKVNVPDVLQGAGDSSLLDLQAGGASRFKVNNNGSLNIYSVGTNTPTGFGIGTPVTSLLATYTGARWNAGISGDRLALESTSWLGFSSLPGTNANFALGGNVDTRLYRDSAGVVKITDGSAGTGYLKLIPTTVGALTAAATVGAGTKAFVTDSTSTLSAHHGQVVVGGGNNFVPVFSDGTNWIVG
jgi:hypothetical protein